jgi:hypothetical protein
MTDRLRRGSPRAPLLSGPFHVSSLPRVAYARLPLRNQAKPDYHIALEETEARGSHSESVKDPGLPLPVLTVLCADLSALLSAIPC